VSLQPLCAKSRAGTTRSRRKLLLAYILTLLWAVPGTADSFTLDQLLDMPLEQLLQLTITSRHAPPLSARWPPPPNGPRTVEHRDAA
jgi:hypothetical protein